MPFSQAVINPVAGSQSAKPILEFHGFFQLTCQNRYGVHNSPTRVIEIQVPAAATQPVAPS